MFNKFCSALKRTRLLLLIPVLTILVLAAPPLFAATHATITVNSTDETINPTDGKCTLREAIIAANTDTPSGNVTGECSAGSGADIVELLANASYTLTVVDNTDPTLGDNGLPAITSDITLNGNGATVERSTADAIPYFRLFQINNGASLSLTNITLANGSTAYDGAGIYSTGTMTVTFSTFDQNGGETYLGGAIYNQGGTLDISDSAFTNNSAKFGGGAIWSDGTMDIARTVFRGNQATMDSYDGGGAIELGGNTTITDSTFEGNVARADGGAVFSNSGATTTIAGSTFAHNVVDGTHNTLGGGGAINAGVLNVTNSTFFQNGTGNFYATASAIVGHGVVLNSTFADNPDSTEFHYNQAVWGVTLKNSILYKTSCAYVTDGGGNLYYPRKNKDCGGTLGDPELGPLQDNGGATATMLPAPDSPALNTAMDINCPATDQRGITRPQGARCDIGAVELEKPTAPTLVAPANNKHITHVNVNLKWDAGERVAGYIVVVRQDAVTGPRVDKSKLTATMYQTRALPRGHWYYWRVFSSSGVARVPTVWWRFHVE